MPNALRTISRIVATVVGGYAATAGGVALASMMLVLLSCMARSEAVLLTSMIGFIAYAAIIIWGWAEQRMARLWAVLGGAALASHVGAMMLATLLPPLAGT
ncbi:CBS-domain-containing membrane protein [Polymorphobacter multimanifer]|uniref:CBS-domain-containing membrane protein n=1 Tax=Polymorphobacter multimanifer TaxID=1070431 RepID=A0A841LC74_9SPHN|nr:iron uptake protein [Polymorphobacter multimanifer]MBB6229301.1 CBS-domain-containing membrane protein [Polymorphobacter multimanifer]